MKYWILAKTGNLLFLNPIRKLNELVDGKKAYIGATILLLQALSCLLGEILAQPLDFNRLLAILQSPCVAQIGLGLAGLGIRHAIAKGENPK